MMDKPLLGTSVVTQIGILVHDVEKSAREFAEFFGVDVPRIGITRPFEISQTVFEGETTTAQAKQAFFTIGPHITIELLEPDDAPSTWRKELDEKGEGVHHIAFDIEGMDDKVKTCQENGMPLIQRGKWQTGEYAYMDASNRLKVVIELLEFFDR